jgi:hypothetical protein
VSEPSSKRRKGSNSAKTPDLEVAQSQAEAEGSPIVERELSPPQEDELEEILETVEEDEDEDLEEEEEESNSESGSEDRLIENNGGEKNGLSAEKMASSRKLNRSGGEKLKSRPAPNLQNKNSKLVQSKKTSPKTKGVTKKVGRPKLEDQNADKGAGVGAGLKGDLAGRRVSTRSKKPEEAGGPTSKRR